MYLDTASMFILHVHFIQKSISDMKYLCTRNHLNYLKFADIIAFLMKPQIILVNVWIFSEGKQFLELEGEKMIPGTST